MRMTCWHSHQPQKHDEPRCSCTDRLYNKSYSTGLENPNDEHDVQYDIKYDDDDDGDCSDRDDDRATVAIMIGWLAEDKQ